MPPGFRNFDLSLNGFFSEYLIVESISMMDSNQIKISDGFSFYKMSILERIKIKLQLFLMVFINYENSFIKT